MKKIILTSVATMGLVAGVFAQGQINVDNSVFGAGVSIGASQSAGQGDYFSGDLTLQVWYLNAATLPGNVTSDGNLNTTGLTAYNNLTTDGFSLAQTYADINITSGDAGVFTLGSLILPNATPGDDIIVALVAWASGANGTTTIPGSSFATAENGGVFAFVNPTTSTTANPPATPAPLSGWSGGNDLVMVPVTAVPEPGTMALAGLGSLSLFLLRRKK